MSWRRFCVLLAGLSADSRFMNATARAPREIGEAEFNSLMGAVGGRKGAAR
jgi:hypothetical protein